VPSVLSVLLARRVFPTALSSLIARLPKGITPLAVVTMIHQTTGSFGIAGLIAGAGALGDALATPVQGRLLDRHGRGRVLLPSAALYVVALALCRFWPCGMRRSACCSAAPCSPGPVSRRSRAA
jgi:MFS family permease